MNEIVYFDNGYIRVTDAVFVAPNGDKYPIRNISAVAVRLSNPLWKLILGIILTLLALDNGIHGNSIRSWIYGIPGIILLIIWWNNYYYALFIGAGGAQQPTIKLKKNDPLLREVEEAINKAILSIQRN